MLALLVLWPLVLVALVVQTALRYLPGRGRERTY